MLSNIGAIKKKRILLESANDNLNLKSLVSTLIPREKRILHGLH
jgi:hypothetical protein